MRGWTRGSGWLVLAGAGIVRPAPATQRGGARRLGVPRDRGAADRRRARRKGAPGSAWRDLTDTFGHRLSGSPQLEAALRWAADEMKGDGLENVRLEPVRCRAGCAAGRAWTWSSPTAGDLVVLGLGGSVGTPADGLTAELMAGRRASRSSTRARRGEGPHRALQRALHRLRRDRALPRRGRVARGEARRGGDAAALGRAARACARRTRARCATRTASRASRRPPSPSRMPSACSAGGPRSRASCCACRWRRSSCPTRRPPTWSPSGRAASSPRRSCSIGGHIDSWDVGTGAMDDGGGSVVVWEAVRLMKSLGLRPRRTVRVVLFTNEENGLRGGTWPIATVHQVGDARGRDRVRLGRVQARAGSASPAATRRARS